MKKNRLMDLIEEGESLQIEFKRRFSTPEKIAKEMIAFANTKGGYLIFGIDDDKSIYGVESEKSEAEMVKDAALNYCEPPLDYNIEYVDANGKEVVVVEIPESDKKPHRLQDYLESIDLNNSVVTIRVNDKSVQASKEMIKILQARYNGLELKNYSPGKNEKAVFEFLTKNETISVKQLSDLVNISMRRASRTLIKLVRADLLIIHVKENGEEYFTSVK
jgi:predicted HTH transcriptional regulator